METSRACVCSSIQPFVNNASISLTAAGSVFAAIHSPFRKILHELALSSATSSAQFSRFVAAFWFLEQNQKAFPRLSAAFPLFSADVRCSLAGEPVGKRNIPKFAKQRAETRWN